MNDEDSSADTIAIDKVRASKAGHAYHEAWAARTALELLPPSSDLTAITLEGFDEQDEQDLGTGAVEIADLLRYHGGTDVARSHRVSVVQFKYSIASADSPVRAADLASTLVKFAITDTELRATHGDEHVEKVVRYEFATNRPIHDNLGPAIAAVIAGSHVDGDKARQAGRIARALENYPKPSSDLLRRLDLVGNKGSLVNAEREVSATLAAWSEPGDPDAEKRLLKLRSLIRIKAGPGSESDKRVDRVAILAELEVEHEDRLYPTPDAFPEVQDVVQRAVLADILAQARKPGAPLIVHAAGGMGKTVLMQGLADQLRADASGAVIGEYDEIDLPEVKPMVRRHRGLKSRCASCGNTSAAPLPAAAEGTPFGQRIHALAPYLKSNQLFSYERLQGVFADLFGLQLSQGRADEHVQTHRAGLCRRTRRCPGGLARRRSRRLRRDGHADRGMQCVSVGVLFEQGRRPYRRVQPHRPGCARHDGRT